MAAIEFENDWETAKALGRFGPLHNWEIRSMRGYESRRGATVHIVFNRKHANNCCMQPSDCVCEIEKTNGEKCWCHRD